MPSLPVLEAAADAWRLRLTKLHESQAELRAALAVADDADFRAALDDNQPVIERYEAQVRAAEAAVRGVREAIATGAAVVFVPRDRNDVEREAAPAASASASEGDGVRGGAAATDDGDGLVL